MKKETKSVEETIKEINKESGEKLAFLGKDADQEVEVISTGIMPLDWAFGCGGLPKGRIIEMHGIQSSGKTSLCLGIISNFQKKGLSCAFIDAEYALNLDHARNIGVDTDKLIIIQPDTGEQAFEAIEKIIKNDAAKLIVIDSASALVPRAVMEAETGKPTMGSQARLISQGLVKLIGPASKNGTIIIILNQLRANIMGGQYDPYTVTGGMALRFYASIIMSLTKETAITRGDDVIGYGIKIQIKKNKVGPPNEKCTVKFMFEGGFSGEINILDIAEKSGIITHTGNTYLFGDIKLGVGENKARDFLSKNPEITSQILELLQSEQ